ncbi:hypothetical protein BGX38DRAFT_1144342 [Terfezia claveryi]|nr:hypothetical protein BGX38DRAFT_1144342 [Terfezia claveryi]
MSSNAVRVQSPRASVPSNVLNIQLDPKGDVILVIPLEGTARTVRYRVNSYSLCLASSVFHAMLGANSHFKEGNALRNRDASSPSIEIKLGDDDPLALAILLRIIHLQFYWVPKTLKNDHLYKVAIVCDKYDMRRILEPWLDQWIPVGTQLGAEIPGDQWLFIAYAFGRQALFKELSKALILTSTVGAGGSSLSPPPTPHIAGTRCSFNQYIPSSILSLVEISTRRQEAIKGIFDYIDQQIEAYHGPTVPRCAHPTKTDLCDLFFLGFLQKMLYTLKIFEPDNHQMSISIEGLKSHIEGLKTPDIIIFQAEGWRICTCGSVNGAFFGTGTCANCGNPRGNHAGTCSPLPKLKRQISLMLSNVQGLEWSQFVRNTQNGGATTPNTVPEGKELLDYFDYNQTEAICQAVNDV